MTLRFGREICGDLGQASKREWLITNGLGGFASGTISGLLTRRYHALLIASECPPVGRVVLSPKVDETVAYKGQHFPLYVNRWESGCTDPLGYALIESFTLNRSVPEWNFAVGDALLKKRILMVPQSNTTVVTYSVTRSDDPLELSLKAFANCRDYHHLTRARDWQMQVGPTKRGVVVTPFESAKPIHFWTTSGSCIPEHEWYYGFELIRELERGLDSKEDHLHIATFRAVLGEGDSVSLVISTEQDNGSDLNDAIKARFAHETELLRLWNKARTKKKLPPPDWIAQLVLAADQFIVKRSSVESSDGTTVIAGYPWFSDWGRDSLISLPGLALATGRPRVARSILGTFAHYVQDGLIPNRFPDSGQAPEYNSVDAALLFVDAVRECYEYTADVRLLRELFPAVAAIIEHFSTGTHFGIARDALDGLIYAGQHGLQLTWMDAKVGDWVVTPRIGKPVEINALWYSALVSASLLARDIGKPASGYEQLAKSARKGFARFWNPESGCCFDVIDGPNGVDASIRPNQLFAVYLPHSALNLTQSRSLVKVCASQLLTSYGLRSLSPRDGSYKGLYVGGQIERDGAYHQGTVWGWLIGPFVLAHLKVFKNPKKAAEFLEPFEHLLGAYGVGTLGEIFDGDAPHNPRGCIAQAWTVAQVLRAWHAIESFKQKQK